MRQKISKILALMFALALPVLYAPSTFAWGPARPTYTNEAPAHKAVFNSIKNNTALGDERDFVRIVEKGVNGTYTSELTIQPDKQYEVFIYYHNDASETFNDAAHNYVGVARDVRVNSYFPHELSKGERGMISSTITATNTDPAAVWDEAYVTASEDMTLHYVIGSAKIYNEWGVNGSVLPTTLFSNQGTFIGLNELNGVILGCQEYSGAIRYTIQTRPVINPESPTNPEAPCVGDHCGTIDPCEIGGCEGPTNPVEPEPCVGDDCPCTGDNCGNGDSDNPGTSDDPNVPSVPEDPTTPGQDEPTQPTPDDPTPSEPDDPGSITPKPTDPNEPATPSEPVTPSELPNTGPVEVVLALVLILAIFAGVYYWYCTHNAVKKATKKARGRK